MAALAAGLVLLLPMEVRPQQDGGLRQLAEMSLEALLDVEVTLGARQERRLQETAAAVFVLTAEEIHRSGATTLPEALRLVPGLQVAQAGASTWVIGSRGFADQYSNKLLVLVDGRSVYSPVFAGVYWDSHDVLLENVERIEVIRGPGAALWGANAVNGIINVVMRSAADTTGGLLTGFAGPTERGGAARWGGAFGRSAHYSVHAKYADREAFDGAPGLDPADAWDHRRVGGRVEWASGPDSLSLDAGLFAGSLGRAALEPLATPPFAVSRASEFDISGGHVLGRWQRSRGDGAGSLVQLAWDRASRGDVGDVRDTVELHAQRGFSPLWGQRLLIGLGYRRAADRVEARRLAAFDPARSSLETFSGFVHDEVPLGAVTVTLGTKLEHHTYTGLEWQPSARVAWSVAPRHLVWAAASGAARTPARAERDIRYRYGTAPGPGGGMVDLVLLGNPDFDSERVVTWEGGYRGQPADAVSLDVALFHSSYDRLRGLHTGDALSPQRSGDRPVVPLMPSNQLAGSSRGVELAVGWAAAPSWRLSGSYSFLTIDLAGDPQVEGSSPAHQLVLRSMLDLHAGLQLDATLYAASGLPSRSVPGRIRLDVRAGWRPTPSLELEVLGRSLAGSRTTEFLGDLSQRLGGDVPRSVTARARWLF